jgi:glycosyltransferase involved in cell wall biosynthesis
MLVFSSSEALVMTDLRPDSGDEGAAIDVLMAAYNGEKYLSEQIESILRQSDRGWTLTVRDDCSTDGTLAIARDYAERHPDRIIAQERTQNTGSAKQNFLEMLLDSSAPYVMFSDDDDVWLDDKISVTLSKMRAMERDFGVDTPLLVHTDLTVADRNLTVTSRSMADSQQLDGGESRLSRLIVQNMVTGCTVMVNRPLADLVEGPFDGILMHDWWLAMVAAAFGRIGFVEAPTVLYRQHGRNAIGASNAKSASYNLSRSLDRDGTKKRLRDSFAQAGLFLEHFEQRLTAAQVEMLRAYTDIPRLGKLGRVRELRRHGFWKNTFVRRLGQVWFV